VFTLSGHGLQPFWVLDPASVAGLSYEEAAALPADFGEYVRSVAAQHGCKIDSVFDLARVLRVSNTYNNKAKRVPVTSHPGDGGELIYRYVRDRLDEFVAQQRAAHPQPELRSDGWQTVTGGTNGQTTETFSRYTLIRRMETAPVGGRNKRLFGVAKDAQRQGDLDADMEAALTAAALSTSVPGDPMTPAEIAATIKSARDSAPAGSSGRGDQHKAAAASVALQRSVAERAAALAEAQRTFRKWLGEAYDTDGLDLMLATLAVERLGGDPLWILLVSGPGNAKTETVQSAQGQRNTYVVSTISSPGALLSATSKRDRAADASGGLLRVIGDRGVLVIKDVTSILSMGRELRAEVLAALREIYDGRWTRTVGTDGGRTLDWVGRIAIIGAVTTAWDTAHAVVAVMGDRFVLLRLDSTKGRMTAGRQAIGNTGSEREMRDELAAAVADVIAGLDDTAIDLTDEETKKLLAAADLVTRARTGVEFDYRGDVIDAHAPEMPTRSPSSSPRCSAVVSRWA
jgi:hypothetical protein